MSLRKHDFGTALLERLEENTDLASLSRWAYELFLDRQREMDPELRSLVTEIATMDDAEEFKLTLEELKSIANTLKEAGERER